MAKRNTSYAVERTSNSLKNAMDQGVEQSELLAIYKSRLFDEELVDKERRNQVLVEVNKNIGINIKMRDIKNASSHLLDQVKANGPEDSPEIIQHADELPPTTPEYILENREEFTQQEVSDAEKILHTNVSVVEGAETTAPVEVNTNTQQTISEDSTMTTNASNNYNSTTTAAAGNNDSQWNQNYDTRAPEMVDGDTYISHSIDETTQSVLHHAVDKDGAEIVYRCNKAGNLMERRIVVTAEEAKAKAAAADAEQPKADTVDNVAEEGFMDKLNNINPAYLAAGAAVIGAAGSILTAQDGISVANVTGGVIGVGASYFAANHFLGERDNNLVTKSIAISGGLVAGAVTARGADMIKAHFWGDKEPTLVNGETVVTVTPLPAPAPAVTVEQAPMF